MNSEEMLDLGRQLREIQRQEKQKAAAQSGTDTTPDTEAAAETPEAPDSRTEKQSNAKTTAEEHTEAEMLLSVMNDRLNSLVNGFSTFSKNQTAALERLKTDLAEEKDRGAKDEDIAAIKRLLDFDKYAKSIVEQRTADAEKRADQIRNEIKSLLARNQFEKTKRALFAVGIILNILLSAVLLIIMLLKA